MSSGIIAVKSAIFQLLPYYQIIRIIVWSKVPTEFQFYDMAFCNKTLAVVVDLLLFRQSKLFSYRYIHDDKKHALHGMKTIGMDCFIPLHSEIR